MNHKEYLESYDGQTIEELVALESKYEAYEIVFVLELALDKKLASGKELNETEQTVLAVQALDREVNNGGFRQFFYNSSVNYANIAVKSFQNIKSTEIAELVDKSIQCLGIDLSNIDLVIDRALSDEDEALEDCFNKLDNLFYESEEYITEKLLTFVKENISNINL